MIRPTAHYRSYKRMYTLRLCVLLLSVLLLSGCTSLWEASSPEVDPSEVTGDYEVQRFRFEPRASALDPINILEFVQRQSTGLELTESQDFILSYQVRGGEQVKVTGSYEVTPETVELQGQEKDDERYGKILLDRTMTLQREEPNTLRFDEETQVSPEKLTSEYQGMTEVEGNLTLELVHEGESPFGGR